MFEIPFTQYLLPDGRRRPIGFGVEGETEAKARAVLDHGWVFEAEILTTGEISLTVSDGEDDRAIVVVANGPGMAAAVEGLVAEAHTEREKERECDGQEVA